MSFPASARYLLTPATSGLAVVQDFLNTISIQTYGNDLLGSAATANAWLTEVTPTDAVIPELQDSDLPELRALRTQLTHVLNGKDIAPQAVTATISATPDGQLQLKPQGRGWQWVASLLWGQVLLAQHDGTLRRLKTCHNPECGSAFYDRSKNNSGVWHNVKTCGNAANLRASRARRKATS